MLTFKDIEDILPLSDLVVEGESVGQISLLLAWTAAPEDAVRHSMASSPTALHEECQNLEDWLVSNITYTDGYPYSQAIFRPFSKADTPEARCEMILQAAVDEMALAIVEVYHSVAKTNPELVVRVPLDIRVRDIVHYRHFQKVIAELPGNRLPYLSLRCDNVLGYDRPEKITLPTFAFCGACLKSGILRAVLAVK